MMRFVMVLVSVVVTLVLVSSADAQYCCVCQSDLGCSNRRCDAGCEQVADRAACDELCGAQCSGDSCTQYFAPCGPTGSFCGAGEGLVCDDPRGVVRIPFCCDPTVFGSGCFRPAPTPSPRPRRIRPHVRTFRRLPSLR